MLIETINGKHFFAEKVIICLPPQLASSIEYSPKLPQDLTGCQYCLQIKIRRVLDFKQLTELLGKEALKFLSYRDKIWTDEFILNGNKVIYRPHQNNGHPLLQENYMD